jgi:hypothetical protein
MFKSINWKETIPILALFVLLTISVLFTVPRPNTNLTYEQKACIMDGGRWVSPFTSGYTPYNCGPSLPPGTISIAPPDKYDHPGCYCGPGKCWDDIKLKCR